MAKINQRKFILITRFYFFKDKIIIILYYEKKKNINNFKYSEMLSNKQLKLKNIHNFNYNKILNNNKQLILKSINNFKYNKILNNNKQLILKNINNFKYNEVLNNNKQLILKNIFKFTRLVKYSSTLTKLYVGKLYSINGKVINKEFIERIDTEISIKNFCLFRTQVHIAFHGVYKNKSITYVITKGSGLNDKPFIGNSFIGLAKIHINQLKDIRNITTIQGHALFGEFGDCVIKKNVKTCYNHLNIGDEQNMVFYTTKNNKKLQALIVDVDNVNLNTFVNDIKNNHIIEINNNDFKLVEKFRNINKKISNGTKPNLSLFENSLNLDYIETLYSNKDDKFSNFN